MLYLHRILRRRQLKGRLKALFLHDKMEQNKVLALVNEALQTNDSLFLIDVKITADAKICIIIDGDEGVPLKECIRISRHIEQNLDREVEDYALEVMSAGLSEPIINKRQYYKNIGKTLTLKLKDGASVAGIVDSVDDEGLSLNWEVREAKPLGKGKITVIKNAKFAFKDIIEAKVKIIFN